MYNNDERRVTKKKTLEWVRVCGGKEEDLCKEGDGWEAEDCAQQVK